MSRFYPISVEVDGRRYTGDWSLLQGSRICVRSAFGSEIAEIGRAKPENVAPRALERVVRAYQQKRARDQAHQEREMAKVRRRRPDPHA